MWKRNNVLKSRRAMKFYCLYCPPPFQTIVSCLVTQIRET
jgi:hypothetical protein